MPTEAIKQPAPGEAELVAGARAKDAGAIALILQQNNQRLYRIARSILRDDFEAEDAHRTPTSAPSPACISSAAIQSLELGSSASS